MAKIWGWVLIIIGVALDAVKLILFLVGASTAPEDFALLPGKAAEVAAFVARQPAFAFYGAATVMVIVGLLLARPRSDKTVSASSATPSVTINSHNQSGGITAHTVNREDKNV